MFRRQLPAYSPIQLLDVLLGRGDPQAGVSVLAQRYRADDVILTDSGTSALAVALRLACEDNRRPVAMPAWGCYDLVTAALAAAVPVVWYDVDPSTLGPEPASLASALETGPGAVVAAHYYGAPVACSRVADLAARAGAWFLEDAAQADGTEIDGRPAGSFGDASVLSFGRGKGRTTGGGGALLVRGSRAGDAAERIVRELDRAAGQTRSRLSLIVQWAMGRPSVFWFPAALPFLELGETVFRAPTPARHMTPFSRRLLAGALKRSEPETKIRKRNAVEWMASIGASRAAVDIPRVEPGASSGYLRFPLVARDAPSAETFAAGGEFGVARGYPLTLPELHGVEGQFASGCTGQGARALASRLFTLPTHSLVTDGDRRAAAAWLADRFSLGS